jgi:ribosome-binding factor A
MRPGLCAWCASLAVPAAWSAITPTRLLVQAHPRRIAKVASQIQREVSNLLVTDKVIPVAQLHAAATHPPLAVCRMQVLQAAISPERATTDSVTAVASITHVHVTNDLQHVKVYVSVYSDRLGKKTAFNNLKKLESCVLRCCFAATINRLPVSCLLCCMWWLTGCVALTVGQHACCMACDLFHATY